MSQSFSLCCAALMHCSGVWTTMRKCSFSVFELDAIQFPEGHGDAHAKTSAAGSHGAPSPEDAVLFRAHVRVPNEVLPRAMQRVDVIRQAVRLIPYLACVEREARDVPGGGGAVPGPAVAVALRSNDGLLHARGGDGRACRRELAFVVDGCEARAFGRAVREARVIVHRVGRDRRRG